jgi:hypothetical protein
MTKPFTHLQSAHCENGVTTKLLNISGLSNITEPLAFGMGSGLFFVYLPFLKINNGPAFAFRTMPGQIFARTCKNLGVKVTRKKFSSQKKAEEYLVEKIENGQPVGCQVGVYYLTYFPKEYRFHFNAHNLIVFGRDKDDFLISDPVMETVTRLNTYELERVRFAKGAFAPKGQLYYPGDASNVTHDHIKKAIEKGIRRNVRDMLYIPGPIAGVKGIKYTGSKIKKWRDKLGLHTAGLYLAQLVRMQEEIGTGGGGFRYIYAAFLQQAQAYHTHENLSRSSELFTKAGDLWRDAAVQASGIYKGRLSSQEDFNVVGDQLFKIADIEKEAFKLLADIKWS